MQKTVAKIHLGNIRQNALAFKEKSGAKLCAVVKANAYGHGGEEVTRALAGVADLFAVATVEEAISIRVAACGRDVLVFTPPTEEETGYAIAVNGFIATVPNLYTARLLAKIGRKYRLPVRAHLKGNTGMNRYGMNPSMLGRVCAFLKKEPYVRVEGFYSHLYAEDRQIALSQREKFLRMQAIVKRYFTGVCSHLSATYGASLGREFSFDMVRIGLGLYGYGGRNMELKKGMEVFARVTDVRKYAFGGGGYGTPLPLKRGEWLSVCRYGYADGFPRSRKNGAAGAGYHINDACMDVSLQRRRLRRGREIPVLLDAEETARERETIPYEVLCLATLRAERIYDEE